MGQRVAGPEIERLIQLLARLPGLGPRSARRAALHLIRKREELLAPLADSRGVRKNRDLPRLRQC
jgi:recombination protein RecR